MIVVTTSSVPGRAVVETLGLVRGSSIRSKHVGRDIVAFLRGLVGGEVHEYTRLMGQVREQAIDRMLDEAAALGADAVVCVRFQTAEIMSGAAEMLCYGTAVRLDAPATRTADAVDR